MALEITIVVFLIVLAIALMMAEIFLLPGITIAGIAAVIAFIGATAYAFIYIGDTAGFISIAGSVIGCGVAFIYLVKSNAMSHIALKTDIDATVDQTELKQLKIGDRGICVSRLNPIGKAEFDGVVVEAKSATGEFIDADETVIIIKVDSSNVLVDLATNSI